MSATENIGKPIAEWVVSILDEAKESKFISLSRNYKMEIAGVTVSIEMEYVSPIATEAEIREALK